MCVFHMCVCAVCVCMCVCVCVCMRESVHVYVCMYVCVMGVRKQSSESTYSMVQLQSVNRMGMRLPSPGRGWLATCWEASQQDCTCQSTPEPVQGQQSGLERSSEGWPSRYCSPLPRRCPVGPHCIPPVLWDLHGHSRTHTTVYWIVQQQDNVSQQQDHMNQQQDHMNQQQDHMSQQQDHMSQQQDHVNQQQDHMNQQQDHMSQQQDHMNHLQQWTAYDNKGVTIGKKKYV